jgi:predicted nucleic acid-binding protein
MRVLLDSNVIIDVIERRDEFFDNSYAVVHLAAKGKIEAFVAAGSISDIYYIIRRGGKNSAAAHNAIVALLQLVSICDTTASDIFSALLLNIPDLEDAILAAGAKREKADFIITRNGQDFKDSAVPCITPTDFLSRFGQR